MSAIYGSVGISNENKKEKSKFFEKYSFDKITHFESANLYFSCYHQVFTKESQKESLPNYKKELNCLITADVILDNRSELIELLGHKNDSISDSEIILLLYSKFRYELLDYIIGDFALQFMIYYDESLFLARDHLGKRTLFYRESENEFQFSTIMLPVATKCQALNDIYLKTFMAINMPTDNYEPRSTIYKNVFHLLPGHYGVLRDNVFTEIKYWDINNPKIDLKNISYNSFKDIYTEAVSCRLRTHQNIGLSLSGGLDSGSVASIAANELPENKKIFSYTAVPSYEYPLQYPNNWLIDETFFVKLIEEKYENINLNIDNFNQYDSLNVMDSMIELLEQPYKYIENGFWSIGVMEYARNDNCKILLDGQFGNLTISYSHIHKYLFRKLLKWDVIGYYRDLTNHCRIKRFSRKKFILRNFKESLNLNKYKEINFIVSNHNLNGKEEKNLNKYMNDLVQVGNARRKHKKAFLQNIRPEVLNHLGSCETKLGLKYNLLHRDPTRDVRVVEFCYHAPIEMFNKDGDYRTLVKETFGDVIPGKLIRNNKRGLQGWDWMFRIQDEWPNVIRDLRNPSSELYKYIDYNETKILLDKYDKLNLKYDDKRYSQYKIIMQAYCCKKYLDKKKNN